MKFRDIYITMIILSILSCNGHPGKEVTGNNKPNPRSIADTKPAASYQDTLKVDQPSVIFYFPDSLQLEKIKAITDSTVFEASMHEYFFQMRNARISIKRDWPKLKIVEAKNFRFLLFLGAEHDTTCIDLNTKNDPYGLFLFRPGKKPQFADMMNIDTQLGFYFKK